MSNRVKPVVVASANGLTMKNGGDVSCVETALPEVVVMTWVAVVVVPSGSVIVKPCSLTKTSYRIA